MRERLPLGLTVFAVYLAAFYAWAAVMLIQQGAVGRGLILGLLYALHERALEWGRR